MPVFQYKASDKSGKVVSDTIAASSRSDAVSLLMSQGLYPASVEQNVEKQQTKRNFFGGLSKGDIEMFTRQIANLLASGLSLSRTLKIMAREASKPAAKDLWNSVHDKVANGMSLAETLAQWPKHFTSVYVAMIQAGETGGFLELVLGQIADFRLREQDLKTKVQSALIYPVVLMVLAMLILLFLLLFFIPRFSSIFSEFGGDLPALTKMIVASSDIVFNYWIIIVGAVILSILFVKSYLDRPEGKAMFEKMVLQTPVYGKLTAKFAFVRFARMLGTLINSGVPLLTALRVAKEAIGNSTISATVTGSIEKVSKGASLSSSLRECPKLFSGSNIEMISVAEESSRLGEELIRLAEVNEKELYRRLDIAVSLLEILMLFFIAVFVGTIVIGMLLPIFNIQELIR